MARALAQLPKGARLTDRIGLGVIAKTFPREVIERILRDTERASRRRRQRPAPMVVYYVIALALYMEVSYGAVPRCLLAGLRWLSWPCGAVTVTGKSGISQARARLGVEPVKRLCEHVVRPIAGPSPGRGQTGCGPGAGAWSVSTTAP